MQRTTTAATARSFNSTPPKRAGTSALHSKLTQMPSTTPTRIPASSMAATHAATPPIDQSAPRTPTSISSLGSKPALPPGAENPNLIRSLPPQKHGSTTTISPNSDKTLSPRNTPLPLTGAAAMVELKRRKQQQQQHQAKTSGASRQTSPNPAIRIMQNLMGVSGISRPADAPAPDNISEPLRKVAEKVFVSEGSDVEQVSPTSLGSFGTFENSSAHSMTATANDTSGQQFVAEPAQMTDGGFPGASNIGHLTVMDQEANKAFSYPGPPPQPDSQEAGPARGMSLPGYGQSSPKSSATSNKRHKCPYCSTDFTRHHNLKSHLLTHSQEKPYVCQTCQARFRRLHDLKRHTKLHTGERPHTCDKCGRRFARGDALARHNKGSGGCAGRRSSFGGDDDYDGDGMDDVDCNAPDDEDDGSDAQGRRESEPSRKRQQLETPQDTDRDVYRQHSSTYPPTQHQRMRAGAGDMGPPTVVHPGSSTGTSPRGDMSGHPSPAGGSLSSSYYGQGQVFAEPHMMTQSPKPLSPGQQPPDQHRLSVADAASAALGRNRSTSLSTQFQQTHFGRGSVDGRAQHGAQFTLNNQPGPHSILPPLGNAPQAQPQTRNIPHQAALASNATMLQQQHVHHLPTASNPSSLSSHGRSSGSSMRDIAGNEHADIWTYVRSIERRFSQMQDEYELRLNRQVDEIAVLRAQVVALTGGVGYGEMGGGQRGPAPYP